jgi:hypothetical protein
MFTLALEGYRGRARSTAEEPDSAVPNPRARHRSRPQAISYGSPVMPPFRRSRRSRRNLTMPFRSRLAQIQATSSAPAFKRPLRKMARQDGRMLRPLFRKPAA